METRTFRQRKQATRSGPPPDAEQTARKAEPRRRNGEFEEEARGASRTHFSRIVRQGGPRAELRREPTELASSGTTTGEPARQQCFNGEPVREPEEIARFPKGTQGTDRGRKASAGTSPGTTQALTGAGSGSGRSGGRRQRRPPLLCVRYGAAGLKHPPFGLSLSKPLPFSCSRRPQGRAGLRQAQPERVDEADRKCGSPRLIPLPWPAASAKVESRPARPAPPADRRGSTPPRPPRRARR